jgi:hypothetical protein
LSRSDISTAVTTPRKIAYIEDTVRAMEEGTLKIRVRSMENEKALERMALTQSRMKNLVLTSVMLTCSSLVPTTRPLIRAVTLAGSGVLALQAFLSRTKVKKFDKTQEKFVSTSFTGEDEESNEAIDMDVDAADEILN